MARKLYVQTPDGQVHIRVTPNDYQYASCISRRDDAGGDIWSVWSWHRRIAYELLSLRSKLSHYTDADIEAACLHDAQLMAVTQNR